jgi:DNA-binding NtrC family response regulator
MRYGEFNKRLSICLVDEDPNAKKDLGDLLIGMGMHIPIFCSNLQQAIEEYENYTIIGPPNLIISEWVREFLDPAFLKYFKSSPLADIPLIIIYDTIRSKSVRDLKEMKIIEKLLKPIKKKDLGLIIKNYLDNNINEQNGETVQLLK